MRRLMLAAIVAASFFIPAAAQQQEQCAPFGKAREILAQKFGETPRLAFVAENGKVTLIFFANDETETWTLIGVDQSGMACIIGAGSGFIFAEPKGPPA